MMIGGDKNNFKKTRYDFFDFSIIETIKCCKSTKKMYLYSTKKMQWMFILILFHTKRFHNYLNRWRIFWNHSIIDQWIHMFTIKRVRILDKVFCKHIQFLYTGKERKLWIKEKQPLDLFKQAENNWNEKILECISYDFYPWWSMTHHWSIFL